MLERDPRRRGLLSGWPRYARIELYVVCTVAVLELAVVAGLYLVLKSAAIA